MAMKMNGVPWHGLWAIFSFLQVTTAFLTQPEFRVSNYIGKWYTIAVVVDNAPLSNTHSHEMTIKEVADDKLLITVQMPESNCGKVVFHLHPGEKPGQYTRGSDKYDNIISVMDTDYDTFAIVSTEMSQVRALHLYSRTPDVSDELRAKFAFYVKCTGLPVDRITYLIKPDAWC